MIKTFYIFILCTVVAGFFLITLPLAAQNQDKVKTLGEILNPTQPSGVITSETMANDYFVECMNKESLAFNAEEKEILCACNAANMSEILTVEEFRLLKVDSRAGKDARGKMLAHSYAPCMLHVIDSKAQYECKSSSYLQDIVFGKNIICDCVADRYKTYMDNNAAYIITEAVINDPMTIDPLEDYFTTDVYLSHKKVFMEQCRYEHEYQKPN